MTKRPIPLPLTLTEDQEHHLYEKANGRGQKAQVDKDALMNLLIDFGRLCDLSPHGVSSRHSGGEPVESSD